MPHERRIAGCTCPICGSRKAEIRLSAKQLAYLLCNACNFQGFARSEQSDRLMRERALPDEADAEGLDDKPAPAAAPAPAKVQPAAPARGQGWGAFPWLT